MEDWGEERNFPVISQALNTRISLKSIGVCAVKSVLFSVFFSVLGLISRPSVFPSGWEEKEKEQNVQLSDLCGCHRPVP